MKRNLILLLIMLLLGALAWWVYDNQNPTASVVYTDRNFAIQDFSSVHKILLADKQGHHLDIERSGTSWIVNGSYPINERRMEAFERVVKNIQIRYIPSDAEAKTAMKQLSAYTNQVKMYNAQGELIRSYLIGGTNADGRGTYMIMEGATQPFVIDLPHAPGGVDLMYFANLEYWITKRLFPNMEMNDIKKLVVKYGNQEANSVAVLHEGDKWMLQPLFPSTLTTSSEFNPDRVKAFVSNLLDIKAGKIRELPPSRNENDMKSRRPEIHIQIYDQRDSLHEFFGWQALRRNKKGDVIEGQKELYSPRQVIPTYYFQAPNDYWYSFSYTKLAKVIKPIAYFYEGTEG